MNSVDSFFQRTQLLTGEAGLEKLKVSRVTVVGLGGVGSHAAEALCRCGVGHISIVDPDRVEEVFTKFNQSWEGPGEFLEVIISTISPLLS